MISILFPIVLLVLGMALVLISDIKGVPQNFQLGFALAAAGMFIFGVLSWGGKIKEYKIDLPKKGLAYKVVKIYDADPKERVALLEIIRPFWLGAFFGPWVVKDIPEEFFKEGEIIDFLIMARLKHKVPSV